MTMPAQPLENCASEHCITCGDDGVPMTVLAVDERRGLALCAAGDGARSTVEIALIAPVLAGDRALVHAGVAIATLPSEAATRSEVPA
jgi:hydrogenase maturation factor